MGEKAPRLRGWAQPWIYPTGLFIRDYLKKHGTAYVQEMWRELKRARTTQKIGTGRYSSFRSNYIWVLKKLGLIEEVRQERVRKGWFNRRYYRIVPGKEDDPAWAHPQIAFDPHRGKPIYRKKYKKLAKLRKAPAPLTEEEIDRIWNTAEAFLREYHYTITRKDFETIMPDWPSEAQVYTTFKRRVGYVIRKAVEIEEVSRVARRLISPERAPEPIARRARETAYAMEREWFRR